MSAKIYTYVLDKNSTELVNMLNEGRDGITDEFKSLVDEIVEKADKYITHNVYYNQDVPMVVNVVNPLDLYTNILYNAAYRPGRALFVNGVMVLEGYCRENMEAVTKRVGDALSEIDRNTIEFSKMYS